MKCNFLWLILSFSYCMAFSQDPEYEKAILKSNTMLLDTVIHIGDFSIHKKVHLYEEIDTGDVDPYFDHIGSRITNYVINDSTTHFKSTESIYSEWDFTAVNEIFLLNDTLLGILQCDIGGGGMSGNCGGVVYYELYLAMIGKNSIKKAPLISTNGCRGDISICEKTIVEYWETKGDLEIDEDIVYIDKVNWAEFGKKLTIHWLGADDHRKTTTIEVGAISCQLVVD